MNQSTASSNRRMLSGALRIFLAEAVLLPTGLLTAGFLSRQLGPEGYGLFTLAAVILTWVEWGTSSVFSRTTIKFISETRDDWQPVMVTVLRQHLWLGSGAAIALCLFAIPIASAMGEPKLAPYLWLFAPQILLFNLSRAHRTTLTGLGRFSEQAIAGASRWIARLGLIVLFVSLGFSIGGAILGSVLATSIELLMARRSVQLPLFHPNPMPARKLWAYAAPMTFYSLALQLYTKIDLLLLKALGGTAEQAGFYGAAQNLALIPGLFSMAFAPVLLSSLGRVRREDDLGAAKEMSRNAMRLGFLVLPLGAIVAGAAPEIIRFIFGNQFLAAAPLLALLIFGALIQILTSVASVTLVAADKPQWTALLTLPLVPIVCVAHSAIIPRWGAIGAASVTVGIISLSAIATLIAVYFTWRIVPPFATFCRSILVCIGIYFLSAHWSGTGLWLFLNLSAIALLVPVCYLLLGEFTSKEIALIRHFKS
ncbi:putative polysaccharide transport protein [Leptolyngbya sp. NIES-3755]|nr:putative polysaccharide transport protein [Leptolyngbya sp. NIES-3755]